MVQPGALPDLQSLQSDPTILQGQRSRTGPGLQEDWRIHGDVGDMTMMAMHSAEDGAFGTLCATKRAPCVSLDTQNTGLGDVRMMARL